METDTPIRQKKNHIGTLFDSISGTDDFLKPCPLAGDRPLLAQESHCGYAAAGGSAGCGYRHCRFDFRDVSTA